MIFITGDTHRDFVRVEQFCKRMKTTKEDILVILGDAGINYFDKMNYHENDPRSDYGLKKRLSKLPITLFLVRGNHEVRPTNIETYQEINWCGANVYQEAEFPALLFAKDGEIYELAGKNCLVIGGAFSIDKEWRLNHGYRWWEDEQLSAAEKTTVEKSLAAVKWQVDIVLSHTCPHKYIRQIVPFVYTDVDHSMEKWLDEIEKQLQYSHWYCGHFHHEASLPGKGSGKFHFMYEGFTAMAGIWSRVGQ
ncbi:MAG: metallophosphoesterase [Lachnospiraceae bacterium]|nr:metallophosphoesterase [Lachnospiraceae bacterium]